MINFSLLIYFDIVWEAEKLTSDIGYFSLGVHVQSKISVLKTSNFVLSEN